jgi:hypothetical protein
VLLGIAAFAKANFPWIALGLALLGVESVRISWLVAYMRRRPPTYGIRRRKESVASAAPSLRIQYKAPTPSRARPSAIQGKFAFAKAAIPRSTRVGSGSSAWRSL